MDNGRATKKATLKTRRNVLKKYGLQVVGGLINADGKEAMAQKACIVNNTLKNKS